MTTTVDRVNASTKSGMEDFLVSTNAGRAAMVSPRVLGPILNVCKHSTQQWETRAQQRHSSGIIHRCASHGTSWLLEQENKAGTTA
jgi:hypothetical protein